MTQTGGLLWARKLVRASCVTSRMTALEHSPCFCTSALGSNAVPGHLRSLANDWYREAKSGLVVLRFVAGNCAVSLTGGIAKDWQGRGFLQPQRWRCAARRRFHVGTGRIRSHNRCRIYDCRCFHNSQSIDQFIAVEGESRYEGLGHTAQTSDRANPGLGGRNSDVVQGGPPKAGAI
jgi:hypothetical protein